MMFYKKGDNLLDNKILKEVCDLMNIQPTEEFQEYFLKDTMETSDKINYLETIFKFDDGFDGDLDSNSKNSYYNNKESKDYKSEFDYSKKIKMYKSTNILLWRAA